VSLDKFSQPLKVHGQANKGDNIEMDLNEVGWEGMDWIVVGQDRGK